MSRLYFGKISKQYPQQFEKNFYAGGPKGNSWYGGMEVGDYVFPIYNSSVSKLWRVKRYNPDANEIDPQGSVEFEVVKEFPSVPISTGFARYRHFQLDIMLLNRLTKSTASMDQGFFPINTEPQCPAPERIDLRDTRNIFIAVENPTQKPDYREGDIRVLVEHGSLKIQSIDVYRSGNFTRYEPLYNLYLQRNESEGLFSLTELLNYALQDNATNKKEFLKSVIDEVRKAGAFEVSNPIGLYDNILVGRKRTKSSKSSGAATDQDDIEDSDSVEDSVDDYREFAALLDANPNLILYGPPGTGKTYAVTRIIEAFDRERTGKFRPYNKIKEEGRVDFVTFHQSFSYEEFVEGLRPVIKTDAAEDDGDASLQYKIQDGILKQIANKAALSQIKSEYKGDQFEQVSEDNSIWKISLGRAGIDEDIYENCIKSNTIAIGFLRTNLSGLTYDEIFEALKKEKTWKSENPKNDARSIDYFLNHLQIGDVVLVFASVTSIRAIGIVTGEYQYDASTPDYQHKRAVRWLKEFDEPLNILKYNNNVRLTLPTLYPLPRIKFTDIREMLGSHGQITEKQQAKGEVPYYLIIDEINRGNISKIFGELITLIEKDKRNNYSCKLPYSQKEFRLPPNLYVIATMNTADRSIALLDIALRRRFYFRELEPDPDVIRRNNPEVMQKIRVPELLKTLNARITDKLDRDHRIGHAPFLNVHTIEKFRMVWYYQVIPLLMEYFYNDGKSVAEIIGDAFIDKTTSQVKWIKEDRDFIHAIEAIIEKA